MRVIPRSVIILQPPCPAVLFFAGSHGYPSLGGVSIDWPFRSGCGRRCGHLFFLPTLGDFDALSNDSLL